MKIGDLLVNAAYLGNRALTAIAVGATKVWEGVSKYIKFADPAVEAICLAKWDTNGDGYLSKEEAKAVTSLGTVFRGNTEITSFDEFIEFENVISIAAHGFYGCKNLSSIKFPNGFESIGQNGFYGCALESIIIPPNLKSIATYAFFSCTKLTSIYIDSLSHLFSIQYANTAASPFYAVSESTQTNIYIDGLLLEGDVEIPSGTKMIPDRMFNRNINITNVSFPNSLITIGVAVFCGCTNLVSDIVIPQGVTSIANNLFRYCSKVASFSLHESIVSIGGYAFSGCGSRDLFIVPSSVNQIGGAAFYNTPIKTFVCKATTPPTVSGNMYLTCEVLYVPDESVEAYKAATNWSTYGDKIKPLSEYQPTNE